jgi:hypothetical protein
VPHPPRPNFEFSIAELLERHAAGEITADELQVILERREDVLSGRESSAAFTRKIMIGLLILCGIGVLSCGGCFAVMALAGR